MNIKKILAGTLIGIMAFSAVGCNMVAKTDEAIKKSPVAKVGDETITRGQLDESMIPVINQMKAQFGENFEKDPQYKDQLVAQKKQMLDQLIDERIELQKAKEKKLDADTTKINADVDKKYNDIKTAYGDKFNDVLKQAGYTETSLKDMLKNQVIIQSLIDDVTKDVKITDAAAKNYYDAHPYDYTEKPDTITASHILVATEDEAKKVKERLDKGEAFDKVAKEVSTDPGSKDKGGDLGEQPYTTYDADFIKAADALKEGQISSPVKTQFGWHIIKTVKKTKYPEKSFDSVKANIVAQLTDENKQSVYSAQLNTWKKDIKIETAKYEKNL